MWMTSSPIENHKQILERNQEENKDKNKKKKQKSLETEKPQTRTKDQKGQISHISQSSFCKELLDVKQLSKKPKRLASAELCFALF